MNATNNVTSLLSSRELQLRGWNKRSIKHLLSNSKKITFDNINFFLTEDVLRKEKTPYFIEHKDCDLKLIRAECRRLEYFVRKHKSTEFSILTFSDNISLFREAVEHYNKMTQKELKLESNMKMSFLSRISVNMLRHTCVEYIDILSSITKERTRTEIYLSLKSTINAKILLKYKILGEYYIE